MDLKPGDTIEILSNKVDRPPRRGTVLEIVDPEVNELRVRWEDDHESVLMPHAGMVRRVADSSS